MPRLDTREQLSFAMHFSQGGNWEKDLKRAVCSFFVDQLHRLGSRTMTASMLTRDWISPFCDDAFRPEPEWDLTPCFQTTTLQSLPVLILLSVGGIEFYELASRWRSGDRPEKGGIAAYRIKLVCPPPASTSCASCFLAYPPKKHWITDPFTACFRSFRRHMLV